MQADLRINYVVQECLAHRIQNQVLYIPLLLARHLVALYILGNLSNLESVVCIQNVDLRQLNIICDTMSARHFR